MDGSFNFDPMTGERIRRIPVPLKSKRNFSRKERILAWVSALIGYLFCRSFWIWQKPITGLLFTLCLFAFAFLFFAGQKRNARSWFYPASALILSCALFFSASPVLLFFVFVYICAAFLLFCQTGSAAALEKRAGQLYFFETVKAIFVSPFYSIGSAFGAIVSGKNGRNTGKTLLFILIGIGIAVFPTLLVLWLLSFDGNFIEILDRIRATVFEEIFTQLFSLILGVPIGAYCFASLYTSAHPLDRDSYNAENCVQVKNNLKFSPPLVGAIAITPLIFLYGVFIFAQRDYYRAIFTATLPDAFTFAEFARNGFFRLCAVAFINALVLIALQVFTKRTEKGKPSPVAKTYTVILSLITVVISGTAISQMCMYVSAYGLTRLRLYTLWFMVLLGILFFVTILKQLIDKLPFAASVLAMFVLCFGLLAIPDTDAIIARHNYDCLLAGTTDQPDVSYLGELAPSSIPVLIKIAENKSLSEDLRVSALAEIGRYAAQGTEGGNLPAIFAARAYQSLDRKTQLKAAVAANGHCPPVYLSEKRQSFKNNGVSCDLTLYTYEKNEKTVFTENPCYAPLENDRQLSSVAGRIEEYFAACLAAGEESVLPFDAGDLAENGRFYIAFDGDLTPYGRNMDSVLYLYDGDNACLVLLHFAYSNGSGVSFAARGDVVYENG